MTTNTESMEDVIRKIKKLLALANDGVNSEETDTAMLLAQKMMAKHSISMKDVEYGKEKEKTVIQGDGTAYTKLQWWMKSLSNIIADNFRCYSFIRHGYGKTKVVFMGLDDDVEIAKMIYDFAVSAIKHYSNQYVKIRGISGDRATTIAVKNDYISGYMDGLRAKFKEQVQKEEFGLVLVKDALVVQEHSKMKFSNARPSTRSTSGDAKARQRGFADGKKFSHGNRGIEG